MGKLNGKYQEFLESKSASFAPVGLAKPPKINSALFPFQRDCVDFLLRIGRGGLFLDTGLGKTLCQLEWCAHAQEETNGKSLILTPLAVAQQINREAAEFGYDCRVVRNQDQAGPGINVCNYERLKDLDVSAFGAVSLDESSILKSFTGKTTRALIDAFQHHRFRLSATATPAPNDHMELGTQSEFCGVMASNEMLSRFFINDTSTASQQWRLKRHAVNAFWDWMASWSRCAQLPSDLGYTDDGYDLPPLNTQTHHASPPQMTGGLFGDVQTSATNIHDVKRKTADERATIAADLVTASTDSWVVWVDTDYEADAVLKALCDTHSVVEVRGSMPTSKKEDALASFADGSARVMVTKPSICGFGLNWQHCNNTVFVGRSFSYESWYQAVRRFWRFGQDRTVNVHIIVAAGEDAIGRVIDRKAGDHQTMKTAMREAMRRNEGQASAVKAEYKPTHNGGIPAWL